MTTIDLSEILFPNVKMTREDVEKLFPKRNLKKGAAVTRFGASPTGYINIGGLYTAYISYRIAKESEGVFILRIEDNNRRDIVDGGIQNFVNALTSYEIFFDEGYFDQCYQVGNYGPYIQTQRENIYKVFVKDLVARGLAYPCFCSTEKLDRLRERQQNCKEQTGYYGKYAECSKLSANEAAEKALRGEPFVIRIRNEFLKFYKEEYYYDLIKGKVKLSVSDLDIIILKETGIPDYNFAHVCDDHLMRTTVITRCEDWLPSLHTHLALFALMGWEPPQYAHIGALSIKLNERSVVKISKSLGESVTVDHYLKKGYTPDTFKSYFSVISGSDLNNDKLCPKNMSCHGAIFDVDKLNHIGKYEFDKSSPLAITEGFEHWLKKWASDFADIILDDRDFLVKTLLIIKGVEKPRKAIACYDDLLKALLPFYSAPHKDKLIEGDREILKDLFVELKKVYPVEAKDMRSFLEGFAHTHRLTLSRVCSAIRRLVVGSDASPSVIEILTVLDKEKILKWLNEKE